MFSDPDEAVEAAWVPLRAHHPRRWTQARQLLFIETLSVTGCVKLAAGRAGLSRESAYRFRRRPAGAAFAEAWNLALEAAADTLADVELEAALYPEVSNYYRNGRLIGHREAPSTRKLISALERRGMPVGRGAPKAAGVNPA